MRLVRRSHSVYRHASASRCRRRERASVGWMIPSLTNVGPSCRNFYDQRFRVDRKKVGIERTMKLCVQGETVSRVGAATVRVATKMRCFYQRGRQGRHTS